MANATLSFTLPEERQEHDDACKAGDFRSVLDLFDNELRNHLRYNSRPDLHSATVEEIRKILHDIIADYGIQIH